MPWMRQETPRTGSLAESFSQKHEEHAIFSEMDLPMRPRAGTPPIRPSTGKLVCQKAE